MDPRAASERQACPPRAAGQTLAEEGMQEARGSGGTCSVAVSGTWALSSSGRGTELCPGPQKRAESKAQNVLGKRPPGRKQSQPQGIGCDGPQSLNPWRPTKSSPSEGCQLPALRIDHSRLGPRKFARGLAWPRGTQRRSPWPLGPAAARAGHGARTLEGLDGSTGQGPRHPRCPLGLS